MTSRDSVPRWLKASVACVALAVLAIGVDWGELPGHLAQLDWRLAALALLVVVLELPVNAAKWWWSLRLHDLNFRWWYLLRTGCIAYFLNNFLPSAIGGDVYRIYKTMSGVEKAGAVSAVLVERIVGLGAMLGYGAFAAIFLAQEYVAARVYLWIAAGGACAAVLVLLALRVMRRSKLVHIAHRSTWLEPIAINLERILRPRREWLALGVYSLLFQSLAGAVVWLAFLAVGADVRIAQAMLITAAAGVASILPISISGLGVVEGAIAGAAVALGVDYDAAVLAALAVRILVTPVSAACGIFLVTSRQ